LGDLSGSERIQALAMQANRYAPELRTHDRFGQPHDAAITPGVPRADGARFPRGLDSLAWTDKGKAVFARQRQLA